jgi:integrase
MKARDLGNNLRLQAERPIATVAQVVEKFKAERMPERFSTRYGYTCWLKNHILPKWGDCPFTELDARPVEIWLKSLPLSPKSRVHIRGVVSRLWKFAMWAKIVPLGPNPMSFVEISGASKRKKRPHSLTVEEFHRFLRQLEGIIRPVALVSVSFGLRISETLALKWKDVNWLAGTLTISRGIVRQRVGDVKTGESEQTVSIDPDLLEVLKTWRQTTQFSLEEDWIFASPAKLGRLPISYPHVWRMFQEATVRAGIQHFGTHSLRHTFRSWMDAAGTGIAVQQKLMRHSDIRTTMNVYGDVVTDEMRQAHARVVRMALPRAN